jgi:hypothetical protein
MNKNLFGKSKISGALFRKHPLFANFALATISLCLSLVIVEFALRLVIPLDSRQPLEFRIPDPILGWALQPNATYQYKTPEGLVSVTYNSQGWRDVEHQVEKPDGVFRILVLGDSFMEANSVKLEESFHRQAEELARAAGKKVEVINMGVAGYGTLQEYLVFEHFGRLYNPDLVLVGFYDGNDLINNSFELASILTEEGQVANARPFLDMNQPAQWTITPVDFEGSQRNYAKQKASLEANRNKLTQKLVLLRLLTAGIARIPNREVPKSQESQLEPVDKNRQEMAQLGVNYCEEPAEYTRAWDVTGRIFARFKEEVEAQGGKLVVFTITALEEVSEEYMKNVTANVAHPEKLCLEKAPGHARLSRMLKELGLDEISLLPDFRRAMREDGINLYHSDLHWSPEGHSLAARLVVAELIKRGLLPMPGEPVPAAP